ncbi:MAG: efflux RND transporter permease subunit [Halanaerobiales bacterium]
MKLSNTAIKRPITTIMMVLLVVLLGVIAFYRVNIDLFPDISFPAAVVITEYEGVGPEEIETMVTRPIEGAVATVTNISNLNSTSSAGRSMVVAEFNWGTDMDMAGIDMREKIDMIEGYLPDEVNDPMIVKFDPSLMPVMQLGVSADTDLITLTKMMEDEFIPRLERLEGVAQVNLVGGKEREILITLHESKINNYNIDFSTITDTLMMENLNISGGDIDRGTSVLLVRLTGKFRNIEEIKNILIPTSTGTVPLRDIAEIKDAYKDVSTLSRLNGETSIGLVVQKQTDANTVEVSNTIHRELDNIVENSNYDIRVAPIMDQADFIEDSIGNVGKNAVIGGLLAIIILFLFLRNYRSTIIIATAIPVSVITTFMLIYFGDLTLNMMTLGGLALGVGMLVDNSIVVLENIYRYRAEGYDRIEAARQGSQEVGVAIVASTLTTIVVFLPIIFIGGIAAELFQELALTVTFSLLASLLVSLTLIPVMSAKMLKLDDEEKSRQAKRGLIDRIKEKYSSTLEWCLDHRKIVIISSIIIFAASIALFPMIGSEFIPEMDQGQFTISVDMPIGTNLEETNRVSEKIERIVLDFPEVQSLLVNVGSSGDMMGSSSPDTVSLIVLLKEPSERERTTNQVMEDLRQMIKIPDGEISLAAADMMGAGMLTGSPISIRVRGDDLDVLEELTIQIKEQLATIEGVREIDDSISEGRPELQIRVDRNLAAQFGLRTAQIGNAVKTAISGTIATRYEVAGEEIDIRVTLDKNDISSTDDIENLLIPSPTGARVPLHRVADFDPEQGPREILRENQVRYAQVTADLYNTNLGDVLPVIREKIDNNIERPDGYLIEYGGEAQEMEEAFGSLQYAFLLAIILVYMVMASQFESLIHPFIVMFTVPMAAIGVMAGLFFTGHNFSVVSIIGVVMLAGIVVNNAIVLIDYINTLRGRGRTIREALLEAGPVRLRPILMTTLTTVLALFPLALGIGEGSEIQAPMAVVVIGGLTVSTLLTLYLVPVLYSLISGVRKSVVGEKDITVN